MININVKLFDNYSTSLNGEIVLFPYNKVEALFYYLVVNKTSNRDELSTLLWPYLEENSAKKNLRNALYKLKECFGKEEILCLTNKSIVSLNQNIHIETDIDIFLNNKYETDLYTGDFLKGFNVKNADNYEQWLNQTREYLKGIYLKRLNEKIELEKNSKNYNKIEKYCKLIIEKDEFNEEAYKNLILCYKNQGKYIDAIEIYDELCDLLDKELSITPNIEVENAFTEILNSIENRRNKDKNKSKEFFYGRLQELRLMESNFKDFVENKESRSILISGEMGIGKTRLKDKFIQSLDIGEIYLCEINCYQFESEYILKSFKKIIIDLVNISRNANFEIPIYLENMLINFVPEISNNVNENRLEYIKYDGSILLMKQDVILDLIKDLIIRISKTKKILFIFEDIQWMDKDSISLLTNLILDLNQNNAMFILTCRNEFNIYLDKLFIATEKYKKVDRIQLNRYSSQEVEHFINRAIPHNNIPKEILNKIYKETEGNTFFITEYLSIIKSNKNVNIMTSKMQDILKSRFIDLCEDEKKILEIVSLFDDKASIYIVKELTKKDELEIMDIIEKLEKKDILKELSSEGNVYFKFTHRKLREFQYVSLSQGRRNILHNKVGKLIERKLNNDFRDVNLYYQLIYHFQSANNNIDCLKYKIKSLEVYLYFTHERFPKIYYDNKFYERFYFDENRTSKKLKELEIYLNEIRDNEGSSFELLELEVYILYMKGRYLIRKGIYLEGVECIEKMIDIAFEIDSNEYAIEGYKQMILYGIQTNNTSKMLRYIDYGLDLIEQYKYKNEKEIFLRFKAFYNIMIGEYETAEKLLKECINTFYKNQKMNDEYILYIAACYNNLGDIKKKTKNFKEAISYYKKAIEICEDKNIWISVSLFQTNIGEAAYCLGDYNLSKRYLEKALNIYKKVANNLGEPIAYSYMSLISFREGKYKDSLRYLKIADIKSKEMKNPKEIGTVYMVKSEIKCSMKDDINIDNPFRTYLNEDIGIYIENAIKYLTETKEEYKIENLKKYIIY